MIKIRIGSWISMNLKIWLHISQKGQEVLESQKKLIYERFPLLWPHIFFIYQQRKNIISKSMLLPKLLFRARSFFSQIPIKQLLTDYNLRIEQIKKLPDRDQRDRLFEQAQMQLTAKMKQRKKEEELDKVKKYLMQGFEAQEKKQQIKSSSSHEIFMPQGIIVKKLQYGERKALMIGVQQQSEDHSIFVKRTAEKLNAELILTALPPDMPYFIKTQVTFAQEWAKFTQDPDYAQGSKFYLNPNPSIPEEACLNKSQIELVRSGLYKSQEFNQISYAILQYYSFSKKYYPNTLLTPLLISTAQRVYFCDFPVIKQRQMWAMSIPLAKLRQIFGVYKEQVFRNRKLFFDPRILFPQKILNKKFAHLANQVKLASLKSQKPVVFVCPSEYSDLFVQQWKIDSPIIHHNDFGFSKVGNKNTMFIEFVKKLAILDIMLEPIIEKYFIKNRSFPYSGYNTMGGKEHLGKIFIVWRHFHNIYTNALSKNEPLEVEDFQS